MLSGISTMALGTLRLIADSAKMSLKATQERQHSMVFECLSKDLIN